jgi:hypothetical protein
MIKVAVPVAIAAISVAGLAAASSAGSTSATTTGVERAYSVITGKAAEANVLVFYATWSGPVKTTGTFEPSGPPPKQGESVTFVTKAGNLAVQVNSAPKNTQTISNKTCKALYGTKVPYKITGGTGKFTGATGHGAIVVAFHARLPKLASGQCNQSRSAAPVPGTVAATFSLRGPITVRG